jgi:phage baseplate assembly protein W
VTTLPRPLVGWPLLPVPDAHGRLEWPTLEDSVRDLIRVVLSTRPGEQLMRPDFGAGVETLLFEPNTVATRRRIHDLVTASIERWERRVVLDRVDVREVDDDPAAVRVEVVYRLARTGALEAVSLTLQMGA